MLAKNKQKQFHAKRGKKTKMKNKKAIEPVVATVLLIVITIVAVALIVTFLVPFIQKQMGTTTACYNARLEIKADESCYNSTHLKVKVARGAEEFTLTDIILKASNATTTKTINLKNKGILANPHEENLYILQRATIGSQQPDIDLSGAVTSVAVAPVVKTGAVEKTCDITSQIVIQPCAG